VSAGRSSTFVAKSGNVLFFEEHGSESGLPVVCLHGIGGGAYFFTGFARRLTASDANAAPLRYRIITVDLPGTGNSRRTGATVDFTLESMAADLGDFVTRHVGEPVVLLGHSFGTILALKAWDTWPKSSIRGLLFVCGLPKARPNIHERLSARADEIRKNGIAGWGPKVSPGVFAPRSLRELPEVTGVFERLFEEQVPETYTRIIDVLLAADLNAVVPTVTAPCAAIGGAEDSYAPPETLRGFVAALTGLPAPCPVTILEGAGHMAFYERPEAFAEAARAFLDSLD
jgi:pimeloyl-ACP methyl ester carboxylesterase